MRIVFSWNHLPKYAAYPLREIVKDNPEIEIVSIKSHLPIKGLDKIIGKKCKDNKDSKERKIELEDVLVVAPFNMQVNNLTRNLPFNSKVGTIDKFQGQEAKIVFISMTSSDPENIPRHKEFFFSRNRLNVAISRAECVAIILFNPRLLNTSCQKIEEMKLINNFCKLLKYKTDFN